MKFRIISTLAAVGLALYGADPQPPALHQPFLNSRTGTAPTRHDFRSRWDSLLCPGYLPGDQPRFRLGVSNPPTLGDPLMVADRDDLTRVFAPEKVTAIEVGKLYQDSSVTARLKVDDLLSKHFIIVGSTGSGKSCALASILQRILDDHKHAHIVVMDIHNEYQTAFGNMVERITLNSFSLPFWLLNFQELTAALSAQDEYRDAEAEILSEGVIVAKRRYIDAATGRLRRPSDIVGHLTVESPTPFRLADVIAYIDEQLGKLDRTLNTLPYRRLKARIETMIADQRYNFMFGSLTVQDTGYARAGFVGSRIRLHEEAGERASGGDELDLVLCHALALSVEKRNLIITNFG